MTEVIWGLPGIAWAYLGAAVAAIGGGVGSAIGIAIISNVTTGVVTEEPDKFGKILPLTAMPGTQGVYGFISALLVLIFFGMFADPNPKMEAIIGFRVFLSCLPVCFVCLGSGIYQGVAAIGAAGMVARRDSDAGRALIFPALVETYAVFSLIVTILLLLVAQQASGL